MGVRKVYDYYTIVLFLTGKSPYYDHHLICELSTSIYILFVNGNPSPLRQPQQSYTLLRPYYNHRPVLGER